MNVLELIDAAAANHRMTIPAALDDDRYDDGTIPRPSWPIGWLAERVYIAAWTSGAALYMTPCARSTITEWAHIMAELYNSITGEDIALPHLEPDVWQWLVDVEHAYGLDDDGAELTALLGG